MNKAIIYMCRALLAAIRERLGKPTSVESDLIDALEVYIAKHDVD